MKWNEAIQKYFGLILFAALAGGFGLPDIFHPLGSLALYILGIIITVSFLTLDYKKMGTTLKKFHIPAGLFILFKVILPAALFFLLVRWNRNVALAVLLLGATPWGLITPALSQLVGGDKPLVLTLTVISSLAAPFYLPFLLQLVGGTEVQVNTLRMMLTLGELVFIPLGISFAVRRWAPGFIKKSEPYHSSVSIILLFFVILGVSAQGGGYVRGNLMSAALFLGGAVVFCAFLAGAGYFGPFFLERKSRLGLAVSIPYMNLALSIVIAMDYFPAEVLLFCVIYEIPANFLPVILRRAGKGNRT